jgi:hypothetical protein
MRAGFRCHGVRPRTVFGWRGGLLRNNTRIGGKRFVRGNDFARLKNAQGAVTEREVAVNGNTVQRYVGSGLLRNAIAIYKGVVLSRADNGSTHDRDAVTRFGAAKSD